MSTSRRNFMVARRDPCRTNAGYLPAVNNYPKLVTMFSSG